MKYYILIPILSLFVSCQKEIDKSYVFEYPKESYSYKNYDIHPFNTESYNMQVVLGDTSLVYYYPSIWDRQVMDILITDEIQQINDQYDEPIDYPVLYDRNGLWSGGFTLERPCFFLKGFKKYNKNSSSQEVTNFESKELSKPETYKVKYVYQGVNYELINDYKHFEDIKVKGSKMLNMAIDYKVSISDGNIKQTFLRIPKAYTEGISFLLNEDIDGDGKVDLIIRLDDYESIDNFKCYYLLFLSSEADEGALIKHVATRIITPNKNYILKNSLKSDSIIAD